MSAVAGEPPWAEQLRGLSRSVVEGCPVLAVSGAIESLTVPRLAAALQEIFDGVGPGRRVVLDLAEVEFLASSGLKVLLTMSREGERHSDPLHIVRGLGAAGDPADPDRGAGRSIGVVRFNR